MKLDYFTARGALALLSAACVATAAHGADAPAAAATPPAATATDSLYQANATLTDQDGKTFRLADLRGTPTLVSMFYTSCKMVCPMLFETIGLTLDAGGEPARKRIKVIAVTVDPDRDSVAVLRKTANAHGLDARWRLVRTDRDSTRTVAALLGIQYRKLASGEFNHSSTIVLLDADGRIVAHTNTLGETDPAFVDAMRKQLAAQ
ncbi:SCO family protein [Burkholderia pseudomallei]|uniref:SCO family protein n=1 Tax=Burkholderia pseudomallei TaxID=28450 RepID=UPI00097739DC|nr:SCO family protein [Burkholderia pseudomallei]ONC96078.1 cytochrome c oxidase assembly protein [Burkholderia pseudomallei]ONC96777.1 cytochrome c oxidase assembly protein [Burkholderia pseudomallei]OND00875.1 cytochrome c oxidase assembly protein [Burkholderia pseudomallei]OND13125.1 cytochrome c oxidase assembly protein [Burkholderia pseudomallei]OND18563.1 cytochrome c oxidase assembly protein [Burkholderia pseudomallei]